MGIAILLAAGLLLAGCSGSGDPTDPTVACASVGTSLDKTCARAIPVATARLGGFHLPVTAVHWNLGMCGQGMQCFEGGATDFGWVIFQFMFGDPVMIHVSSVRQADGSGFELVADAQQLPPTWVIDTLDDMTP